MSTNRHPLRASAAGLLVVVTLSVAVVPTAVGAAEHPGFTLTDPSQTASWGGEFVAGAFGVWPVVSLPEACTPAPELCDVVPLEVQLAASTWQGRPGGMLIAVQSPVLDTGAYDLDLFVYAPDGSLAASSASWLASEAVWLPDPINGRYTVVVVPRFLVSQPLEDAPLQSLTYEGWVEFERGLTVQRDELLHGARYRRQFVAFGLTERHSVVELLPDLVPTTPRNFHIEGGTGAGIFFYVDRGLRHPPSCYPEETLGLTEDKPDPGGGPLRCLRFDLGEHNFGAGPFELHIYEGSTDVYQRIYATDGSVRQIGPLGQVRFSQEHGHFHYTGFQAKTLYRIEDDGSLTWVREGLDKGICTADIENNWFGRTDRPTSALGYPLPGTCLEFSHRDDHDPMFGDRSYMQMGISVGWSDVYPWYVGDQYLDITGVPDGRYAIVVRQDIENRVRETDETNNTAMGCVRIEGDVTDDIPCASG